MGGGHRSSPSFPSFFFLNLLVGEKMFQASAWLLVSYGGRGMGKRLERAVILRIATIVYMDNSWIVGGGHDERTARTVLGRSHDASTIETTVSDSIFLLDPHQQ